MSTAPAAAPDGGNSEKPWEGLPVPASEDRLPSDQRERHINKKRRASPDRRVAWAPLLVLCALVAALHVLTNGRYGFHRDELQFLDDGSHLAWGFVAYPPLAPTLARLALFLFGPSLEGLRIFALLPQLGVIVVTALLAHEFKGGWFAQISAALAIAAAPLFMFEAHSYQYTGLDLLWCLMLAWCVARRVNSRDARWWLAIGAVAGLGLMTKYTMGFYLIGLAAGVLLTPLRRDLTSRWFWYGATLALAIFLPNIVWQFRHDWVSLHFLQHIHARDVVEGRADGFWAQQLGINMQDFAAPLAVAGLAFLFLPIWRQLGEGLARASLAGKRRLTAERPTGATYQQEEASLGRRFCALGWMFISVVAAMAFAHGRGYYTGGVYPMLFAAGGAFFERGLEHLRAVSLRRVLEVATLAIIFVGGALTARNILPVQQLTAPNNVALSVNGDLREEVGWTELVRQVAAIRDALPAAQRAGFVIVTNNYGETGAIDLLGPQYGLPPAISVVNTAWYRGYPATPPQTVILLGSDPAGADRVFQSCQVAGHNANPWGVHNEESDYHPDIFVCGPMRQRWDQVWPREPSFG